jgi:hypothetical protein
LVENRNYNNDFIVDFSCNSADITGLVSAMLTFDNKDDEGTIAAFEDDEEFLGAFRKDSDGYYYFHPSRKSKYSVMQLKNILLKLIYLNTEYEKN